MVPVEIINGSSVWPGPSANTFASIQITGPMQKKKADNYDS